jgi:hypothetical protein
VRVSLVLLPVLKGLSTLVRFVPLVHPDHLRMYLGKRYASVIEWIEVFSLVECSSFHSPLSIL